MSVSVMRTGVEMMMIVSSIQAIAILDAREVVMDQPVVIVHTVHRTQAMTNTAIAYAT